MSSEKNKGGVKVNFEASVITQTDLEIKKGNIFHRLWSSFFKKKYEQSEDALDSKIDEFRAKADQAKEMIQKTKNEALKLHAETEKIKAETGQLEADSDKTRAEAEKLRAEADKLRAEALKTYIESGQELMDLRSRQSKMQEIMYQEVSNDANQIDQNINATLKLPSPSEDDLLESIVEFAKKLKTHKDDYDIEIDNFDIDFILDNRNNSNILRSKVSEFIQNIKNIEKEM